MSFEVRMKKRTKMIVLRIFSGLMAAVLIWFINLDFIWPALMQDGAYLLFIGFIGIFLMFFAWSFYAQKRPRIKVDGQNITFYPMWRPSQKVTLSAVTARDVKGDATGEKIDAAIGGALLSPPLADALEQRYTAALQNPNPRICLQVLPGFPGTMTHNGYLVQTRHSIGIRRRGKQTTIILLGLMSFMLGRMPSSI